MTNKQKCVLASKWLRKGQEKVGNLNKPAKASKTK